jgi:hypothetical protein
MAMGEDDVLPDGQTVGDLLASFRRRGNPENLAVRIKELEIQNKELMHALQNARRNQTGVKGS